MAGLAAEILGGGFFLATNSVLLTVGLQPRHLIIAAVCAALGAFILSRFTMSLGSLTYPINFCALFAGAIIANLVAKYFQAPLDYSFQRPLLVSIAGMAVASVITLLFLSRSRSSD